MKLTEEQQDIINWVLNEEGILLVEAGAGTGKSSTAKVFINQLKPKSGIYTAFNKAIVEEGIQRFKGTNVECKTFHALAYQYVKPKSISSFSYDNITEDIPYTSKKHIITTLDTFFVSDCTDMEQYFKDNLPDNLVDIALSYVYKMAEDEIPATFNYLLKALHLLMYEGEVEISTEIVILDEINDVTPVTLEIFKLIKAPKKVGLGETHQAIYQFLNLTNGFEVLHDIATTKKLTNSFRCSKNIASYIENLMFEHLDRDFDFKGTDTPCRNGKALHCTLTNAAIVQKINECMAAGKSFTLLRKPADIFAAPLAVLSAACGKVPFQKQYNFLHEAYINYKKDPKYGKSSYFKYLLDVFYHDEEIVGAVKTLQMLNSQNINLFKLYSDVKDCKPDPSFTIATVYTSKGLEFERVFIDDSLNYAFAKAIADDNPDNEEQNTTIKRCYYVACSRAGCVLQNVYTIPDQGKPDENFRYFIQQRY